MFGTGLSCKRGLNCTRTKLHEDDFAPRVNFVQVPFLHESKKIQKKITSKNKQKKITSKNKQKKKIKN